MHCKTVVGLSLIPACKGLPSTEIRAVEVDGASTLFM